MTRTAALLKLCVCMWSLASLLCTASAEELTYNLSSDSHLSDQSSFKAVSALNAKAELLGGRFENHDSAAGGASFAIPLGDYLGLQIDGFGGRIGDMDTSGGATSL
ncbi:hypothetical protein [Desulfovulcanus sp.]